jgi:hypothetical protein
LSRAWSDRSTDELGFEVGSKLVVLGCFGSRQRQKRKPLEVRVVDEASEAKAILILSNVGHAQVLRPTCLATADGKRRRSNRMQAWPVHVSRHFRLLGRDMTRLPILRQARDTGKSDMQFGRRDSSFVLWRTTYAKYLFWRGCYVIPCGVVEGFILWRHIRKTIQTVATV